MYQLISDKAKSCKSETMADFGPADACVSHKMALNYFKMSIWLIFFGAFCPRMIQRSWPTLFLWAHLSFLFYLASCILIAYRLYLETDEVNSSVCTTVKEVAYTNRIWDTAEYTIPMQTSRLPLIYLVAFLTCLCPTTQCDYFTLETAMFKATSSLPPLI